MRMYVWILLLLSAAATASAQVVADGRSGYFLDTEHNRLQMEVHVWGEVLKPGSHRVMDDTDLVGLLSAAGGPSPQADLRHIKITRRGESSQVLDVNLLRYLDQAGRMPLPPLRPGDTVRIGRNSGHRWGDALRTLSTIAVVASSFVYISDRLQ